MNLNVWLLPLGQHTDALLQWTGSKTWQCVKVFQVILVLKAWRSPGEKETRRGLRWRCILRCNRRCLPRIAGIMERHRDLLPWAKIRVPEESLRKLLVKVLPNFSGDPSSLEIPVPPKTSAAVEWSQPEPRRQIVCAAGGRSFFFFLF